MGRKKQKVRWTTVEDGFFGDSGCDSQQQTLLKTTTSPTQTQDFDPEFTQVPPPTSVTGINEVFYVFECIFLHRMVNILFRNKRFVFNEIFLQNASKLTMSILCIRK